MMQKRKWDRIYVGKGLILGNIPIRIAIAGTNMKKDDTLIAKGWIAVEVTRLGADAFKVRITSEELAGYGLGYAEIGKRKEERELLLAQVLQVIEAEYRLCYRLKETVTEFFPDHSDGCYLYLSIRKERSKAVTEQQQFCAFFRTEQRLMRYMRLIQTETAQVYRFCNGYFLTDTAKDPSLSEFADIIAFDPKEWALFTEYALLQQK